MYLIEYMDAAKLASHIENELVDIRYHRSLPLRILTYSQKAVLSNTWDDITTKCRGLIIDGSGKIISRPFEKFFNFETTYRPETQLANLPTTQPCVQEKLDGSLGILYEIDGHSAIATKGSFHSDQAIWATGWYKRNCPNPQWPEGFTPVFEIIAESVQHHVVHYYGVEELVLLGLVNNETGEEASFNTCYHWAHINGLKVAEIYGKTLAQVLKEDRKNTEDYVLSWPRPGRTPLKVKVKHQSFLDLQKIVHAATPKAILEALEAKNVSLLDTWIGQTHDPIGAWVKSWVTRLNWKYAEVLLKSNSFYRAALLTNPTRKGFAEYVRENAPTYASVCFAMLDGKDHQSIIWKIVEQRFAKELSTPFAVKQDLEKAA